MGTKNLLIDFGQSNGTPVANQAEWLAAHPEINPENASLFGYGASTSRFEMPGNFPGYDEFDLRSVAVRPIRYLTFYNPSSTSYKTYPCVGRLALIGAHLGTTIYVEQQFEIAADPGNAVVPFTIVRQRTGVSYTVTAVSHTGLPAGAGSKLTLAEPWDDPVRQEQFDYTLRVTGGTGTATLTVAMKFVFGFGTPFSGDLVGLLFRCVTGANAGQSRVIQSNVTSTDPATPNSTVITLDSAFANAIVTDADTFSITPQSGTFENFAFWLPWCPYEAGNLIGHPNPYPPGFNYPNHWSIPQPYRYDAGIGSKVFTVVPASNNTVESIGHNLVLGQKVKLKTTGELPTGLLPGSIGLLPGVEYFIYFSTVDRVRFSTTPDGVNIVTFDPGTGTGTHSILVSTELAIVQELMAWHTGVAAKMQQLLGGDLYVITAAIGGVSLARSEVGYYQGDVGWFDGAAETCWTPSEPNNCYRRMLRQIDAGIAAAAADGDTLVVRAVLFPQGEADAQLAPSAANYAENLRALKAALRTDLKARGLWPRSADLIPFIQPKIDANAWPFAATVNEAIQVVAEEDRASRSLQVDDLTFAAGHVVATSMGTLEQRALDAFVSIRNATDQVGEVSLCNQALKLIGDAGQITSIDPVDGSAQSAACAELYPTVRDSLLEQHAWGFATKRVALTPLTSTTTVWTSCYLKPGDVSHVLSVQPPEATSDNVGSVYPRDYWTGEHRDRSYAGGEKVPQPYSVEQDPTGRQVIYTNMADAVLVYVQNVTDTRRFSGLFNRALVYMLAADLALSLVRGDAGTRLAKAMRELAGMAVIAAKQADMLESDDPPDDFPGLLSGMH